MKKIILAILAILTLNACQEYIPYRELHGKILTDSLGKRYKLEWQDGHGESWRFLEEVRDLQDSSKIRWIYVAERK